MTDNTDNVQESDLQQMERKIWVIVGGSFTLDSLGSDKYESMISHVRARAKEYLDVLESMFLGNNFDAELQSHLYIHNLLRMVADIEPEHVRQIAEHLLNQLSTAEFSEERSPRSASQDASTERGDLAQRLEQRRNQLQYLIQ
jgi:hypothetical protein